MKVFDLTDILAACGIAVATVGAALIAWPLALVVPGVYIAMLAAWRVR